jgi:hypothetical protein
MTKHITAAVRDDGSSISFGRGISGYHIRGAIVTEGPANALGRDVTLLLTRAQVEWFRDQMTRYLDEQDGRW